ncbi:MAG: serine protease [Betaproteobacteria bacterium]|nr:serine protease [Betaproteobacteria bacterium]
MAASSTSPATLRAAFLAFLTTLEIPVAFAASAPPAVADARKPPDAVAAPDAERLFRAVVKVSARAVPNARSAASLGSAREGTGVLIGSDGLIVTIGYLIVEADEVTVTDHRGRVLPATVVGYDHASGFGLLRAIVPIDATPVALGASGRMAETDPVMIASHGGVDEAAFAWVVSKRPFTGSWEYMLDEALWTSPPTSAWSGAGLIDRDGKLVGVGSLIVRDATGDEARLPGNLFVPIDALKAVLAELVADGRRKGPARPWLGVAADEVQGRLIVSRVSPDSPADEAGVEAGDIILGVAGEPVRTQREFYRRLWAGRSAGAEVPLRLLQGADVRELKVRSIDRVEYFRPPSHLPLAKPVGLKADPAARESGLKADPQFASCGSGFSPTGPASCALSAGPPHARWSPPEWVGLSPTASCPVPSPSA